MQVAIKKKSSWVWVSARKSRIKEKVGVATVASVLRVAQLQEHNRLDATRAHW